MPNIEGYRFFRQDRDKAGSGGGVCIYVEKDTQAITVDIPELNERDIEQIWCVVRQGNDSVLIGCIYRPPNSSLPNHLFTTERIINTLGHAKQAVKTLGCSSMYVYGDFNLPHIRYESIDVEGGSATIGHISNTTIGSKTSDIKFLDALEELELQQLVTFPTYCDSQTSEATNTLDLLITDDANRVFAIESDAPLGCTPKGRAHFVIKWRIAMASSDRQLPSRKRFIWSKANWNGLNRDISSYDWVNELGRLATVNDCYNYFINCYKHGL